MIEITNLFLNKEKHQYNNTFNKGLNLVDYNDKIIFDLLSLKELAIKDGKIDIDGYSFFPTTDDEQSSIFSLTINSSSAVIASIFVVKSDEKKQKVESLKTKLLILKDIVPSNNEEHASKIDKILSILIEESANYVLIDKNNKVNIQNDDVIFKSEKLGNLVCIVLDKEAVIEKPVAEKFSSEKSNAEAPSGELNYYDDGFIEFKEFDNHKMALKSYFKLNIKTFAVLLIPILGVIAFVLSTPYYFAFANYTVGGFFIAGLVICSVILYIFEINMFDFFKHKDDKNLKRKWIYASISHVVTLIVGTGAGIGLFFLITLLDKKFDIANYSISMILPTIIMFIVIFLIPLYVKYLRLVVDKITSLFKKKKKND
ncbi:MAG: hypothetical protein MJ227_01980 [Bacilli bacterium]|nr:hypothetical protein [Bacilli bacterium]